MTSRLPDVIIDFCDESPAEHHDSALTYEAYLLSHYVRRGLGAPPSFRDAIATDDFGGTSIAFINFGRWIVQCQTCRSAVIGCHHTPYFMCVGCGNVGNDGKWLRVTFPVDRESIEERLLQMPGFRTNAITRNWQPGE